MSLDETDTEALEYVLALTERDDRRAFEAALLDDPAIAERVWQTEEMFAPLAAAVRDRPVPPRVKRALEARLFGPPGVATAAVRRVPGTLVRAVGRGLAAAALAGLALVAILLVRPELVAPASAQWVAAIVRNDGGVTLAWRRTDGALVAEPFAVARAGSPELWLVPAVGSPQSLGLLEAEGSRFRVPAASDALFRPGSRLVVTLEPEGGSPTGQPTGPALGAGNLTRI
jgi:anti-sigma-K factor RskA